MNEDTKFVIFDKGKSITVKILMNDDLTYQNVPCAIVSCVNTQDVYLVNKKLIETVNKANTVTKWKDCLFKPKT